MVEHVGIWNAHKNEPEECREQGEARTDWLKQLIEEQRHADIARTQDQLRGAAKNIRPFFEARIWAAVGNAAWPRIMPEGTTANGSNRAPTMISR